MRRGKAAVIKPIKNGQSFRKCFRTMRNDEKQPDSFMTLKAFSKKVDDENDHRKGIKLFISIKIRENDIVTIR